MQKNKSTDTVNPDSSVCKVFTKVKDIQTSKKSCNLFISAPQVYCIPVEAVKGEYPDNEMVKPVFLD